jgi:hypothetical protein
MSEETGSSYRGRFGIPKLRGVQRSPSGRNVRCKE